MNKEEGVTPVKVMVCLAIFAMVVTMFMLSPECRV